MRETQRGERHEGCERVDLDEERVKRRERVMRVRVLVFRFSFCLKRRSFRLGKFAKTT